MATCCPTTFTGYCLSDGTPIAIIISSGGVITGWVDITTGIFTSGPPPAGTGICPTELQIVGFDNTSVTNIPSSITAVTLASPRPNRKVLIIFNESSSILRVKLGLAVSTTDYTVQIGQNGSYEFNPAYTGEITGIWAAVNGFAMITEGY